MDQRNNWNKGKREKEGWKATFCASRKNIADGNCTHCRKQKRESCRASETSRKQKKGEIGHRRDGVRGRHARGRRTEPWSTDEPRKSYPPRSE